VEKQAGFADGGFDPFANAAAFGDAARRNVFQIIFAHGDLGQRFLNDVCAAILRFTQQCGQQIFIVLPCARASSMRAAPPAASTSRLPI